MAKKICVHCGETINVFTGNVTSYGPLHDKCGPDYFRSASSHKNQPEGKVNPDVQEKSKQVVHSEPKPQAVGSRYETALMVAGVVSFLGWLCVVAGFLVALFTVKQIGAAGVALGMLVGISGLFQVMGAQLISATVETADNTRAILAVLQRQ